MHTYSQVFISFSQDKEHSGGCQQSQAFPFWTIDHLPKKKNTKHVGWFSLPGGLFPVDVNLFQRSTSWRARRSRTLTFSCGFSLILWIVCHSAHCSLRALTFCCPLYAISACPWLQQRQKRALVVVDSHELSAPSIGPPFCFGLAWSRVSPF